MARLSENVGGGNGIEVLPFEEVSFGCVRVLIEWGGEAGGKRWGCDLIVLNSSK